MCEYNLNVFYRFENSLVDLTNFKQWIFVKTLDGENSIYVFAEVHPFDSSLPWVRSINIINVFDFVKLSFA